MQLQVTTSQAIQLLQHLHCCSNAVQSGQSIAVAIGLTYQRFVQVATRLRNDGLLISTSGRYGGYTLGKSAEEISLYDVALSVQGELHINHCSGKKCEDGNCKTHRFLQSLQNKMIAEMSNTYIADLA